MVYGFYVEVELNERHINAPSAEDIVELVRAELVGPGPEEYGISRVRVANTQWTAAQGTVKMHGGMVGQQLLQAAQAALKFALPMRDVVAQPLKPSDRERWQDAVTALQAAVQNAEVR